MAGTTGINPTLADATYSDVIFQGGYYFREQGGRDGSISNDSGTAERVFSAGDSQDPLAIKDALLNISSIRSYGGAGLVNVSWDRVSRTKWDFTLEYSVKEPSDPGTYTISVDTTGGTILQTSAYDQAKYDATGKTGSDFGYSIDVQDGVAQGVQRVIPALKIDIRAKIASAYISSPLTYSKLIAQLTGTTNNAAIYDDTPLSSGTIFEAGELLFMGATGDVVGESPALTFHYLASKNVTGLTIGDITGISKKGHEYLWFAFFNDIDSTTKLPVQKPRAAYVAQVYGSADHSLLKIGVA